MTAITTRIVIDTDTGIDDFFAIVQALRSPELEVIALTTVGGNVPLRYATRNAMRALEYARRPDVSVMPGAARPLRGRFGYAFYFHGPGGLPAAMPRPSMFPVPSTAVDYLFSRFVGVRARRRPVTLVALGPATNVARVLRRLRGYKGQFALERIVVMGGAVDVPGNVTPFAEFNTWNDPEAAAEVFASGASHDLPVTLIPLDVCNSVKLTEADFGSADPTARRLGLAWLKMHSGRQVGFSDCVAIAAVADPGAFRFERIALGVDTSNGPERGRTSRVSVSGRVSAAASNASRRAIDVAMRVDVGRVRQAIRQRALAPIR